jgi:hypothetical protein
LTPARKKPRLWEPLPTTTDEAASKAASIDTPVALPPPAADDDSNADLVTDTQPNAEVTGKWTLGEDALLTSAVTNTPKTGRDKAWTYTIDCAIAALVPGRTNEQTVLD